MIDKIAGFLEVGRNEQGEVVITCNPMRTGVGHVVFSPAQARELARLLAKHADEIKRDVPEARYYFFDFNTELGDPEKLRAICVRLDLVPIVDILDPIAIDLRNHPLYPRLALHVEGNKRYLEGNKRSSLGSLEKAKLSEKAGVTVAAIHGAMSTTAARWSVRESI